MIDSVEPLSCVLWAVAFFAAGMYPLGFMMGAPCSPCCDPQCGDEPIEFNRCIRFVNTDTDAPPTTYAAGETVSQPLHGFSRAVTRPEQIGARRVGTKANFTARILLLSPASAMSDGETQSATYRYRYLSPTGADLGTAKQWNVTLVGVTRPLSMSEVVSTLQYQVGTGSYNSNPTREYSVGLLADSTSAAVSATVHSVTVVSGGQFLDGNTVTDEVLKAMLTATIPLRNGTTWVAVLAFAATNAQFQHVPTGTSISLEYVIKHSRGTQHRYRTFAMTVLKFGSPVAIPAGGLSPLSLSQPAAIDTPYAATPATYSNDDPDAVSIYSSDAAGEKILKTVEVVPVGEQMRRTVSLTASNSQHLLPSSVSFGYAFTEYGYIMRPFDPGGGYAFDSNNHPANSPWNYNVGEVESFLSGGYTLPYNSGTSLVTHNNTWTMEVTDPTQFCGVPLCNDLHPFGTIGAFFSDVISRTITVQTASFPPTYTQSDESGTSTVANLCYGQDSPPLISLRIATATNTCLYSGQFRTCENPSNNSAGFVRTRSQPVKVFYCGDLLWVIENGPCRNNLTVGYLSWGNEIYTLGGDDNAASINNQRCHSGVPQRQGECAPSEVTLSLNQNYPIVCGLTVIPYQQDVSAGDYVLSAGYVSCLERAGSGMIPINETTPPGGLNGMLHVLIQQEKTRWCNDWNNYGTLTFDYARSCGIFPTSYGGSFGSPPGFPNLINGSVVFGANQPLLPAYTVAVTPEIISPQGGVATISYCCPQRTTTVTILPANRFSITYLADSSGPEIGTPAYITQEGQGNTYCPFTVEWLSGSSLTNAAGFQNGRIFLNERCPIMAQVSHAEQPPCEWSVTSNAAWLIAEKIPEEPELEEGQEDAEPAGDQVGLLKLSINTEEPAVFAGSFANTGKQFRSATITITSGTAVNTWTIIQLKP